MMRRIARHARVALAAGAVAVSLALAVPAVAIEDCNKYKNPVERGLCMVQIVVQQIFDDFFDN